MEGDWIQFLLLSVHLSIVDCNPSIQTAHCPDLLKKGYVSVRPWHMYYY